MNRASLSAGYAVLVIATIAMMGSPAAAADFTTLSWSIVSVVRDSQSGVMTATGAATNNSNESLSSVFTVVGVGTNISGSTVTSPTGGVTIIQPGATQQVIATVPAGVTAGMEFYLCAATPATPFEDQQRCSLAAAATQFVSSSARVTAPATGASPLWAARIRTQSAAGAIPAAVTNIDLSALTANTSTQSAWLFGCTRLQSGGGVVPACQIEFTLANGTTRLLPVDPPLDADYRLYFRGADNRGNLRVCADAPWPTPTNCKPVWNDGMSLAISSIRVSIGTTAPAVAQVTRNVPIPPPPSPILTVTAPTVAPINSATALPTLTFTVTRQNPSTAPSGGLVCSASANTLNYSCSASGTSIIPSTSAACVCTSSLAAPGVTFATPYTVQVTASAAGATQGSATATLTVQPAPPPSGNRGCTDDLSVPVIEEINFATTSANFMEATYDFSTVREGVSNPQSVGAVRLVVTSANGGGGQWQIGSLQISAKFGASDFDGVISRCRGQFGPSGREQVLSLSGYRGPESQGATIFFAGWIVNTRRPSTSIFDTLLLAPGVTAQDGWLSDGIYYINLRQIYCSVGFGSTCTRAIRGGGSVL